MIIEFLLSSILGFGLHQTKRITEHMPTQGFEYIGNYSIGGLAIFLIFWPFWYWRLKDVNDGFLRGWLSVAMSLLSFGGGVVAGWLFDE